MNFVKDSPRDVTSFLRMYHDSFDEAEIGDYLGEGDEDFKVQVRLSYVRAISFKGMTLVESLRHFLTNGGFRLPGEAQKIERMVEAFAQCYYEDSPASFSSADTAMIIAYSIIMLNTDLHNPQVKKNKMSKEQFVKNNRGIDNGKDLPKRFLEEIYEDIAHHPMHIKGTRFTPKAREPSSSLLDLESDKFRGNLSRSVAQFEELLKDLSQSYYTFNFVGVDACISPDLIKL
uniref:SEC7 domain-containing protein n=1 Tax=Globisporangium ultimum (strain ATCC 200006 / CBS 805.95 / DAOM BR144) TaxID=431595 RepID=K3WHI1_GLOUD